MTVFSLQELLLFALAALLLVLTPGPNMVYCVSRSLTQGPRAGLLSLVGVVLGFLVHLLAAALGLTALLLAVPMAFDAIRVAGAVTLSGKAVPDTILVFDSGGDANERAARTGPGGEYEVLLEEPGDYTVRIGTEWNDRLDYHVQVPAVTAHRLDFALPAASVAGTLSPSGGAGVACTP